MKTRTIINDNGHEITITNILKFSREHGWGHDSLSRMLNGKIKSYKGYRLKPDSTIITDKREYRVLSPDGRLAIFTGLNAFCEQNRLNLEHMRNLINDKTRRFKGWTIAPDNADFTTHREYKSATELSDELLKKVLFA